MTADALLQRLRPLAFAAIVSLQMWPVAAQAADETADAGRDFALTAWTAGGALPAETGSVLTVTQDAAGFLWLGTGQGLVRFDGFKFTAWGARGEPPLPGRGVRAIMAADDGSLWVAYSDVDGVSRIKDGRLVHYSEREGLPPGVFQSVIEDQRGAIWIGGHAGLGVFERGTWRRLGQAEGVPDASVYSLYEDRRGKLWVGTSSGVLRRSSDGLRFEVVDADASFVQSFTQDAAGGIWITDRQRILRKLHSDAQPAVAASVRLPVAGWRLLTDLHGNVWIAALGSGLLRVRVDRDTGKEVVEPFTDSRITGTTLCLFADREGNVWVGMRGGLLRLSESVATANTRLEGLTNEGVRGLTASKDGSVWVATTYRLSRFLGDRQQVYDFKQTEALHTDRHGDLWVVTLEGIHRQHEGRFEPVAVPSSVRLEGISSVTTDAAGGLWLCGRTAGTARWHAGRLEKFADAQEVARRPCSVVYTDRLDRVWIGFSTGGGVAVYQGGRFRAFTDRDGLVAGNVTSILEDESGGVWVSTTNGLSRFANNRFATLTRKNGLPETIGPSIVEDSEGRFWVSAGTGIVRFSPNELGRVAADPQHQVPYTFYDRADGLSGALPSLSRPGAVRGGDGRLWFATEAGVSVIDTRRLRTGRRAISVRVDTAAGDGRSVPVPAAATLPNASTVDIVYAPLSLSPAGKLRFRHKLDGLDRDWVYAGERQQVTYSNLRHGNYQFRVMVTNDGLWREPEAIWGFAIRPAFYQTRSFYVLCVALVGLGAWSYWWLSLRAVAKKYAAVLAERVRVSRDIHDTLLQSLSAVALQLEVVARQLGDRDDTATGSLRGIQKQIAVCIKETRQSVWDLRSGRFEQRKLSDCLKEIAASATSGRAVDLSTQVTGRQRPCPNETGEDILRIAREAIGNAVRHGSPRHVRVELDYRPDSVLLRISDDGCGFVPDALPPSGQHYGLLTMQERAASLGGHLNIVSAPGSGTVVEATVPLAPAEKGLSGV